jgi:hypothetical protein
MEAAEPSVAQRASRLVVGKNMLGQGILSDVRLPKWHTFKRASSPAKNGGLEQFVLGPTNHETPRSVTLASCVLRRSAVEQLIEEVLAVSAVYCACCMQLAPSPIDHVDLSGCEN